MTQEGSSKQSTQQTYIVNEDDYYIGVKKAHLINKQDLKRSILLKRRMHWDGQNNVEKFIQKKKIQKSQPFTKKGFEDITCPICMELFVRSTSTICGHCFCERCLFEGMLRKPQCPICRTSIKNQQFLFSQVLDNQIRIMVEECKDENIKKFYHQRKNDHNKWIEDRQVKNMEIGLLIDVLDSELIWCVGRIEIILNVKNNTQVKIHYEGWNKMYDEYISINSYRLAPKGFYTERSDIPRYLRADTVHSQALLQQELEGQGHTDHDASRARINQVFDFLNIFFQRNHSQNAQIINLQDTQLLVNEPSIEINMPMSQNFINVQNMHSDIFDGSNILMFSDDEQEPNQPEENQ